MIFSHAPSEFSDLQVRSQVAYGSVGEVDRFETMVGVKAMVA